MIPFLGMVKCYEIKAYHKIVTKDLPEKNLKS